MVRKFSFISLALGIFLLFAVSWPMVEFKVWEMTQYKSEETLLSPTGNQVLGISALADFSSGNFGRPANQKPYDQFNLTVPKMHLNKEMVLVESNNFDTHLAHLPGSALPGEKGNVFITGHSSVFLGQLHNKKPIFNNLESLRKGDQIQVDALGQHFVYDVIGVKVVNPTDVYVINPPDSKGRYLSLMTCVPPGLITQRLVVLSKLNNW